MISDLVSKLDFFLSFIFRFLLLFAFFALSFLVFVLLLVIFGHLRLEGPPARMDYEMDIERTGPQFTVREVRSFQSEGIESSLKRRREIDG